MNLFYKLSSFLLFLSICIFAIALAMVNTDLVSFNYYIEKVEISLSLLLVFSFIVGVFMTFLVLLPTLIKLKFQSGKNKRINDKENSSHLKLINPNN